MKKPVKIYEGSSISVSRLASLLDQNDIPSMIRDIGESGRVAGFGVPQNSVELYVYQSDAECAQKLIEAYHAG